ncbi:MAG: hypothetical protein LBV58_02470 [Acholeplasmatales bacterium]|jgi:hypothetical protein|nr:hypothetical protein [Acholeplasmatales bacterium]
MITPDNNKVLDSSIQIVKESWFKRWYSFNKQSIPAIFAFLATILITAFVDFEVQGTPLKLESHFLAISKLGPGSAAALFIFLLYLISIIQLFNCFTFRKKNNLATLILIQVLTISSIIIYASYVMVFINEANTVSTFHFIKATYFSLIIFGVGLLFMILASIFTFFYVDLKYVKEKE